MRILVAEDERDMNRLIVRSLERSGYAVDCAFDGNQTWMLLRENVYDAVIMDIMMPGPDGLTLLSMMRDKDLDYPVIMLTARDSIEDRVDGLERGADDYIIKPFSLEELQARLKAVIRRAEKAGAGPYRLADLTVDPISMTAERAGKKLELSAKEFSVLLRLIQNSGNVVSREDLLSHCWNFEYTGGSNVVDVYIRYLRQKLDDPFEKKLLCTVRGVGYTLRDTDR